MGEFRACTGCMGCAQGWVGVLDLQQLCAVRVAVRAGFSLRPFYAGIEQWWHLWHLQLHLWHSTGPAGVIGTLLVACLYAAVAQRLLLLRPRPSAVCARKVRPSHLPSRPATERLLSYELS